MNALTLTHKIIQSRITEGSFCIDATAGRGKDTAFLCRLAGKAGKVMAFDIQEAAIKSTKELLDSEGLKAELILDSHANILNYAEKETVDCIVFNLGYLPGGDHRLFTHFESSRQAIEDGLMLLKKGAFMCVTIYHGGDTGYEERDKLLEWLKSIDNQKYQVLVVNFHNWENDPPIPVFIRKLRDDER